MTFSANPARTTLRDRLRRLDGPQRALLHVVVAALVLMALGTVLTFFLARTVVAEQATQFGNALAAESAQRAAEYLVHDDLVSLNVVTASLTRLPGVIGVTVYDKHRQPLAQSGHVQATPDTLTTRALILTEEQDLRGSVELLIDPAATSPALARLHYALAGWLAFTVVMLLLVARLQREHLAATPAVMTTPLPAAVPAPDTAAEAAATAAVPGSETDTAAAPAPVLPAGVLLCLDALNIGTLEQRLAPRLFADAVEWYDEVLARAAALYQGQVQQGVAGQALVVFRSNDDQDDDALFRAVCCAQLFLGVVRETIAERKALGNATLQFTAALHLDPQMDEASRAVVTREICTQAGIAGRLTITDPVGEHPVLGERLVVDNQHRQLLQIEIPAAGDDEAANTREVAALGVLRLADPWEDLLARQVRRLCEPTEA